MGAGDLFRAKAVRIRDIAAHEPDLKTRIEYERLALACLRLALMAERNANRGYLHETPPPTIKRRA
jgi:hypothetical protein